MMSDAGLYNRIAERFYAPGLAQELGEIPLDMPFAPIGDAGVAAFALPIESGARLTMTWLTDTITGWSGLPAQRASVNRWPQMRFDFQALLSDAEQRFVMSELAGSAADAPIFLLGLAHEDRTVTASSGTSLTVSSLSSCDWNQSGQRVIAVHPETGQIATSTIVFTGGSTIITADDISAIAIAGALVMPALQVHLEPDQSLGREAVNMGDWNIVAFAQRPFTVPIVGLGATVATFEGLPVWDAGIAQEHAEQPMLSGTQLVDLGGRVSAVGSFDRADWARTIRIERGGGADAIADWQWFKRFLDTVRGRFKTFLLPSGRPDLVPIGDASSGTLVVEGPPTLNAPDYAGDWFSSDAHRRLKLVKTDGTFAYRSVSAAQDNLDGTQNLSLDATLAGALARVEFLETCRLDSDQVVVELGPAGFTSTMRARVVQR
jgi:hypothetical protein